MVLCVLQERREKERQDAKMQKEQERAEKQKEKEEQKKEKEEERLRKLELLQEDKKKKQEFVLSVCDLCQIILGIDLTETGTKPKEKNFL